MAKKKKKIEIPEGDMLDQLAAVGRKILGKDAIEKAIDSEYGDPRIFYDTGIPAFNAVLDREKRGYPAGRSIELYGANSTNKSGLAMDAIARVQQAGGLAVLIPAEGEYSEWLAKQYGVDTEKLLIVDTNVVEEAFATIKQYMRIAGALGELIIVVDSIAGLCTKAEYEDDAFEADRQAQVRAQLLSKALRKIGKDLPKTNIILFLINQVNDGESTGLFKTKPQPPGGRRLGFYASIRLRVEQIGKVKRKREGEEFVAGFHLRITAEKNRLAMPFQSCELILDFEKGLRAKGD